MKLTELLHEIVATGDGTTLGKKIPRFAIRYDMNNLLRDFTMIPPTVTNFQFIADLYKSSLGKSDALISRARDNDILLVFPKQGPSGQIDWNSTHNIANSGMIWNQGYHLTYLTGQDIPSEDVRLFLQAFKEFKSSGTTKDFNYSIQKISALIQKPGNIIFVPIPEFLDRFVLDETE